MSRIAVVSDSTANIPTSYLTDLPIFITPLEVIWNNQVYRDNIDITAKEFYERLAEMEQAIFTPGIKNLAIQQQKNNMPTTSASRPQTFVELYTTLFDQGYDGIISIHPSEKISSTINAAREARASFPEAKIAIFDSCGTSMMQGFQVLLCARTAAEGKDFETCCDLAAKVSNPNNTSTIFIVNTLEFLYRGGRIGKAKAMLGSLLNLKPILKMNNGVVEALGSTRTMKKAIIEALDHLENISAQTNSIYLACCHANDPSKAEAVLEMAANRIGKKKIKEKLIAELSPVIGVHTGPGTITLAYVMNV
jgi:DegV family protein with EDD domain